MTTLTLFSEPGDHCRTIVSEIIALVDNAIETQKWAFVQTRPDLRVGLLHYTTADPTNLSVDDVVGVITLVNNDVFTILHRDRNYHAFYSQCSAQLGAALNLSKALRNRVGETVMYASEEEN